MFYLKELYIRIIFSGIVTLSLFLIFYIYIKELIFLIVFPFIIQNKNLIKHFIYTHPIELLSSIIQIIFLLLFIFCIPYITWTTRDFLKSSLTKKEEKALYSILTKVCYLIILVNIIGFTFVFPIIWLFFESFNFKTNLNLKIYLELKIEDYIHFVIDYLYLTNTAIIILLIIYNFIVYNNINFLLKNKKYITLMNIIIATFISPPDIVFQLILFMVLQILLEFIHFFILFKIKFNTVTN